MKVVVLGRIRRFRLATCRTAGARWSPRPVPKRVRLPVRCGWFPGIHLPAFLLPKIDSREFVKNGAFHFDVAVGAPLGGGLIVRYRGKLRPDGQPFGEDDASTRLKDPARPSKIFTFNANPVESAPHGRH